MTNQIDELTKKIVANQQKVKDIDGDIATYTEKRQQYVAERDGLEDTLNFLNNELAKYREQLRAAYNAGNDANTAVALAKQNLVAANARWEKECQIESEATLNLEKARAEEALAKLALDEIVARYSNALPYAIVPNGNGVGAGSPNGNNPSGSALGPATRSASAIQIDNWTHYLSSAFGQGINPSLDANINYLYPFSFSAPGLRGNNNVCSGNGAIQTVSGTISHIDGNTIQVQIGNSNQQVNFGTCTHAAANKPGYSLSVGDQVVAKGTSHGHGNGASLDCQQAVFVAE